MVCRMAHGRLREGLRWEVRLGATRHTGDDDGLSFVEFLEGKEENHCY